MPIAVPIAGSEVNVTNFGKPVADEVNRMTPLVVAPTAWVNLSLVNGWVNFSGYYPCQYRKIGDIVYVRGSLSEPNSATGTFATLPIGFRPTIGAEHGGVAFAGQRRAVSILISTDGGMSMDVLGAGTVSSFPGIFFATN